MKVFFNSICSCSSAVVLMVLPTSLAFVAACHVREQCAGKNNFCKFRDVSQSDLQLKRTRHIGK